MQSAGSSPGAQLQQSFWNNSKAFNKRLLTFNKKLLPRNSKSAFSKGKQAPRVFAGGPVRSHARPSCGASLTDLTPEW